MKRPSRYPYTRSQWTEEIAIVRTGDNRCFKLRVLENQVTGERK
nr:MAG TPA: HmuY protein [Caudoviricetes sp.]